MDANLIEDLTGIAAGLARLQMEIASMRADELAWQAKLQRVLHNGLDEEHSEWRN